MENDSEGTANGGPLLPSQTTNVMANGPILGPSQVAPSVTTLSAAVPSGSKPLANIASSTKTLSNIQPKGNESSGSQRTLVPKNDSLTTAVQQLTAQPAANILVQQPIQHVLINGQLYPIIQTTNGTHLLIQQPMGQVQQGGKQVFTAQPIQLGAIQPAVANQQPAPADQHIPVQPAVPANTDQSGIPSDKNSISTDAHGASAAPQSSRPVATTTGSNDNTNTFMPSTTKNSSPNAGKGLAMVDARTQQLLTRIQNQIDAFKSKPSLDSDAKNTLQQLEEAQQRVLSNVRAQANKAPAEALQNGGNHSMMMAPPQAPAFVHPNPQYVRPELLQSNFRDKPLVIKPAKDGESAINEENINSIIQAFTNVKVGNQIYNINLMEDQKNKFIEEMSKMSAEQQHSYLAQQQTEILQTVFRNQQELQMKAMAQQTPMPQAPYPMATQQQQQTPQPQTSKPNQKGRPGRRPGSKGRKPGTPSFTPPRPPTPSVAPSEPAKVAPKKPRPSPMSTKRIGEKMLQQIMKDQEVLLKPGNHKKPFTNKNQVKERLFRFHLFYTAEPYKTYRRLHEENLYEATAHETVLTKEKLFDRFRPLLWRESINTVQSAEDVLIADLLLQDEREALNEDQALELNDIERFKSLYKIPEREPTPPPTVQTSDTDHQQSPRQYSMPSDDQLSSPTLHKTKGKTHKQSVTPEDAVIRRVKRETAREARKRRAAERKSMPKNNVKGKPGKRGRPRKNAPISPELQQETKPVGSVNDEKYLALSNISELKDDESSEPSSELSANRQSPLEQTFANERVSEAPSEQTAADESSVCTDSEDELIDIGSPLTPPMEVTSPLAEDSDTTTESPQTSSPLCVTSNSSSPMKGFAIYSETVIEQSDHPRNSPYHPSNAGLASQTNMTPYGGLDTNTINEYPLNLTMNRPNSSNGAAGRDNECFADDVLSDSDASNTSSRADSDSSYIQSADEDVGGMPVTWEDNAVNVPSEAASEVSESEHSTYQENHSDTEDETPIMPLRINKKKLEDYNWQSDHSGSQSPLSIKLKINNPAPTVPPPIKLRIKRDVNDKWEAASSVSSYASDADQSDEGEEYGAGQNSMEWENNGEAETSYSSDETDVSMSGSDVGYSQQAYPPFAADDAVPFGHYVPKDDSNDHFG